MIPLARPIIGEEEIEAVAAVMRTGQLAQGEQVARFEDEFAAYLQFEDQPLHAVATANGTTALQLALHALGVGPGSEVILPSFTFIATASAVHSSGATPVLVDVDPRTFTLTPEAVAAALSPRTAAAIAVHLYGHPADLTAIGPLLDEAGVALIEDAAQAHGAAIDNRKVGTFGLGCFSFYPTKNMTTGEGGMVTTANPALADRMRLFRNHGMGARYQYEDFGLNLRMTEMAAAMGRVQLAKLETWNEARAANAAWLDDHLAGVTTPFVRPSTRHAYHQYTVLADNREALLGRLRDSGVGAGVYYPQPLHHTVPFKSDVHLPVSEDLAQRVVSLPVRPGLDEADLRAIAAAVCG